MTLTTFYLICLILGGTVFVLQTLLTLLGLAGAHEIALAHDVSHDAHVSHHDGPAQANWLHGIFTLRAIVAGVAFFGILGLFTQSQQLPTLLTLAIALAGALTAMALTAVIFKFLTTLSADGNVYARDALGKIATVYLTIPAANGGMGKIQVNVKDRTMEYAAATQHPIAFPTGTKVLVVDLGPDNSLLVASSPDTITVETL